jgi:hypothetical protein
LAEFVASIVQLDFTKLLLINALHVMELAKPVRVMQEIAQAA